MKIINHLLKVRVWVNRLANFLFGSERELLALGRMLSENVRSRKNVTDIRDVEFRIFSQWGDDGIIQWLVSNLEFSSRTFVEFGVGNYRESNTRFLMMNNNWSGLVMDGSAFNVAQITHSEYFWKYELSAHAVFIDSENINDLLTSSTLGRDVGLLHIDLDGNDYWIWKAIDVISPIVVILEYNSLFGTDRAISIPYDRNFSRSVAHRSTLYYGASLPALHRLSAEKGYAFIGCNSSGNNAYFVRKDRLNDNVQETSLERGFVVSKFRESRDESGDLSYLSGRARSDVIRGLPVFNVLTNQIENF